MYFEPLLHCFEVETLLIISAMYALSEDDTLCYAARAFALGITVSFFGVI